MLSKGNNKRDSYIMEVYNKERHIASFFDEAII